MPKKIINYKAKISRSISNMVKTDCDIFEKNPDENAITSNLFRRIQKKKNHFIEMEYDNYVIKAGLINEVLNLSKNAIHKNDYNPKPDIIAHYSARTSDNLVLIAESKKFSKGEIVKDYLKIWAYKISTNVQQGALIIFPNFKNTKLKCKNVQFRPSTKVHSLKELSALLNTWKPFQTGVVDIIFNKNELDRIVATLKNYNFYTEKNKRDFIIQNIKISELYRLTFIDKKSCFSLEKIELKDKNISKESIKFDNKEFRKMMDSELIEETPPIVLSNKITKEKIPTSYSNDVFELSLFGQKKVLFEHNVFGNNSIIKFYFENENIKKDHKSEPIKYRRNILLIGYSLEYGFVMGFRNIKFPHSDLLKKIENLGFGHEKGITWKYYKISNEVINPSETPIDKGEKMFKLFNILNREMTKINMDKYFSKIKKEIGITNDK